MSNDDATKEQFNMEEGTGTAPSSPKVCSRTGKLLSDVSKKYDFDGDGRLDEMEQAMRDMDKSGKGFISNEKVYQLMKHQVEMQKQIFNMKKITIGLAVFTVILALTNLGTAWAAAVLAKETQVNPDTNALEAKGRAGETLSTLSTGNEMVAKEDPPVEERRRLGKDKSSKEGGGGAATSSITAGAGHTIAYKNAEKIWKGCAKSTPSSIKYTCQGGKTTSNYQVQCTGSKSYADPKNANKVIYEFPAQKSMVNPLLISCDKNNNNAVCNMANLPCAQNFLTSGGSVPISTGGVGNGAAIGGSSGGQTSSIGGNCNKNLANFEKINQFTPYELVCQSSCECASNCCLGYTWGSRCVVAPPNPYMKCMAM